jgi:hypothetical protein
MGFIAENARRFFHPSAVEDMLATFVPQINANNLDVRSCLLDKIALANYISECPCNPILHGDILAFEPSTTISTYALSMVGISQFL